MTATTIFDCRVEQSLTGSWCFYRSPLQPLCVLGGRAHPLFVGENFAEKHAGECVLPVGRHFAQLFDDLLKRGCHTLYCSIED
jgi:hypothetical protein